MNSNITQYLGILGNILFVVSYLPQIKKIIVTKKSEDISTFMWLIILFGDLCMLLSAVITNDTIFAILFTVFIIENSVLLYLAFKFKNPPALQNVSPRENMNQKKDDEAKKNALVEVDPTLVEEQVKEVVELKEKEEIERKEDKTSDIE